MTIASEIQRIKTNIANAYDALENKGATMPATEDSANLASTVNTVSTGGGDEITATNTTGSAVSADDRVWVNGEDVYTPNYTVKSSPTITDKILSNVTQTKYLYNYTGKNSYSINSMEFCIKIKANWSQSTITVNSYSTLAGIFGTSSNTVEIGNKQCFTFWNNNHFVFGQADGIGVDFGAYSDFSDDTWYWFKGITTKTSNNRWDFEGFVSIDGVNWTQKTNTEYTSINPFSYTNSSSAKNIILTNGTLTGSNGVLNGLMYDLSECYIKMDNELFWTPYTKTGTNYSIINDTDITSTSFTGIAQEAIANNATGSVKTLLDGNGSYAPTTATKSITTNGTYTASAENAYGLSEVTVNVSGGGMDTVEAYNDTGSAISTGDKVWINKGDVYSYNFNVIGNPIINKDTHIASGFGADNFLTKTGFSSANPWEINLKVKFSNVSAGQNYFSMIGNGFSVASGQWQFALSSTSGEFDIASGLSVGSVSANTWYWVRFVYSGTDYKFYVSTDGETYSLLQTFNSSAQMKTNGTLWFGNYAGSSTNPNPATYTSIDLSETYMDIDGQSWWTAITKVWDNNYKLDSFLAQNTPNVTKMGSVTLTDNYIGSGFNSSNYLKSNRTISEIGTADSWEFVTRVCMTSSQSSNGMIINQNTGNYGESGFMFFVGGSNTPVFQPFDQNLNLIAGIDSSMSLQNNQWYWLKGEFTGTAYNFYISTDKETWTTVGTAASTTKVHTPTSPWRFGSSVVNSGFYLYGKIDFKETYLKINNEVAWSAIGYGMSGNITEDTLTGTAAENIAIGGTGDVEIGNVIEPTLGTKTITANGTYNASSDNLDGFSSVTVDVPSSSGVGIPREVSAQGVYQMPANSFTFSLPSNATNVGRYGLYSAFYGCTALTSVDLSALTTVSGYSGFSSAFQNCMGLTSVDLSSLTTISGDGGLSSAFYGCTALTSVDLSSLTTVSGDGGLYSAFDGCAGLTSINLSSLTTVSGYSGLSSAFQNCMGLTSVSFPKLATVTGSNCLNYCFSGCTGLTDVYFPALTTTSFGSYKNQFSNMMANTGTTTIHTLHFPLELASTISGLDGYPDFGGTSGYVDCAFEHDFGGGGSGSGGSSPGR